MFNIVSGAIIKPGFSIINECLKYGIPIFCFNKYQNVEFKYNCNIIKKHKLGFVNNKLNILLDKLFNLSSKDRKRLLNKYKKLKWNGEKKIIDELQEK